MHQGSALLLLLALFALILPPQAAQAQGFTGVFVNPGNRFCLRQWPTGAVDCRFATITACRKSAKDRRDNCVVNNWETTGSGSLNKN